MSSEPHFDEKTRVEAFGAIRRAAEEARRYDAQYDEAYFARDWEECERITSGHSIRVAIRAAIRSEKA